MRRTVGLVIVSLTVGSSNCAKRTPVADPVPAPTPVPAPVPAPIPAPTPPAPMPAPRERSTGILEIQEGLASFYGKPFHGKTTASGIKFDMHAMVAAHPSYPFGTLLRVTNLANGRSVRVRILDRGPAAQHLANGIVIDLSRRAAEVLDFIRQGQTRVRLEVLVWGEGR